MMDDADLRSADPQIRNVAATLLGRLGSSDDLSVWALLSSSSGSQFMVLLIDDGSGGPRVLFGIHRPGERSLPDRVDLDDLEPESVVDALATAYRRAVQRGDEPDGCDLELESLGTPSEGRVDDDIDRAPTARIAVSRISSRIP